MSNKHGCKLGASCLLYNKGDQKTQDLKNLMNSLSSDELLKWSGVYNIFKIFLQEHPKYYKASNPKALPAEGFRHFIDFLIIRTSSNKGNVYDNAYKVYSEMIKQKNTRSFRMTRNTNQGITTYDNAIDNSSGTSGTDHSTAVDGINTITVKGCNGTTYTVINKWIFRELAKSSFLYTFSECGHVPKIDQNDKRKLIYYCTKCNKVFIRDGCRSEVLSKCCISSSERKNRKLIKDIAESWIYNIQAGDKAYINTPKNYKPGNYENKTSTTNPTDNTTTEKKVVKTETVQNADGTTSTIETYDDGSKKTTTTDQNGNTTETYTDANGNPITPSNGETGTATVDPARDNGYYSNPADFDDDHMYRDLIVRYEDLEEMQEEYEKQVDDKNFTFKDALGNILNDVGRQVAKNVVPAYNRKGVIFGLPLRYNALCDPNGRVFAENTLMDLPLVYIMPGRGIINPTLSKKDEKDIQDGLKDIIYGKEDLGDANDFLPTIRSLKGNRDLRALAFEPAFDEYIKYINNLASTVWGLLGLKGIFKWDEELGEAVLELDGKERALTYFMHSSTQASESFSNEYTDSQIVSTLNAASATVRQFKQLFQKDHSTAFEDSSLTANMATNDGEGSVSGGLSGVISSLFKSGARIINGSQLLYPQVWQDSRFDRTYNLTFRFFSPYGDKQSIFNNVYLPVLCLMALTLPRMDNISGYAQPFYVRVNCPGMFQTDIGCIESLTIEKGGDDKLWTVDNLPNEIECTVTVKDMYPTLALTTSSKLMAFNMGLTAYLDCMAGIRTDDLLNMRRLEGVLKNKMSKAYKFFGTGTGLWVSEAWQSFLFNKFN